MTTIAAGLASPTSLEYQPDSERFIVVARPASSSSRALEAVTPDGDRHQFGPAGALPADAPLAVAQEAGDFDAGDVFTARTTPGQIVRLTAAGKIVSDPWIKLPGETGTVTALAFSYGGPFANDLIAATNAGNIWRVTGEGVPSFVASIGHPIAAIIALPASDRYGDAAGKLLAATADPKCLLASVDAAGNATTAQVPTCIADFDLVVPHADAFFTGPVNIDGKTLGGVLKASAGDFASLSCAVLATPANGSLATVTSSGGKPSLAPLGMASGGIVRTAFAGSAMACQPELCGDAVDNDGDGDTDEGCEEVCDGIDNNSNGETDEGCRDVCGDGEDNDGNGVVDDGCVEVCGDGIDNDSDDLTDSPCAEICRDGIDNDGNGVVDDGCPSLPVQAGCPAERWTRSVTDAMRVTPELRASSAFQFPDAGELAPIGAMPLIDLLKGPAAAEGSPASAGRRLLRAGVAGLLSATHPEVGYPIDARALQRHVSAALASGETRHMTAVASVLEAYNRLRCTLPKDSKR